MTRVPFPAKTPSNAVVNLLSRSRIRNLNRPGPLAEVHQEIACLLGGPGPSRMSRNARDVHGPGLDLHHERHTRAGAARYLHAGSHRPGCRMPGQSETAARSATPAAARDRDRRRPGSGGSSPPRPGALDRSARPGCAGSPSAGSAAPAAPPAHAPRPGLAAVPARSDKSISS
jgi:hypothetical protein